MGVLRRRAQIANRRGDIQRGGDNSPIPRITPAMKLAKLAVYLVLYMAWSSYQNPKIWAFKLREIYEKGLEYLPNHPYPRPEDLEVAPTYRLQRIPCGLMIAADGDGSSTEENTVLPIATSAAVETIETENVETQNTVTRDGISMLHVRALEKYPQLEKYIVTKKPKDEPFAKKKKVIPEGTFRLRMDENTIETSPALWIMEGKSKDTSFDMVLGTDFWKDHSAEFGSDEVYLLPSPSSTSRVMVPYLSMRSKPYLDTEDIDAEDPDTEDIDTEDLRAEL